MATDQIVADFVVWAVAFGFGSIFSWLVWLTIRHYNYGKPAYEALAGGELDDGHLETTADRFEGIERTQADLAKRVDEVERKVDNVDDKTDLIENAHATLDALYDVLTHNLAQPDGHGVVAPTRGGRLSSRIARSAAHRPDLARCEARGRSPARCF
jgi:hypothetical protein